MCISKRTFDITADGRVITCWRLTHPSGAAVEVLDFGATTCKVEIPDNSGKLRNVCMGFETIKEYEESDAYSGAIIGRHAGRVGAAEFELGGQQYMLAANDGPNHLHGGLKGFSHKVWQAEGVGNQLVFRYTSSDGEEGYPGELSITTTYEWTAETTLSVTIDAICDKDTVASFTHHGYWNLSSEVTVGNHLCQVHAPTFVAADKNNLPTGEILDATGTPFDFRVPQVLSSVWNNTHPQIIPNCGFDHTFPVPGADMRELGTLSAGNLKLIVSSTLPALHIYTGKSTHIALEAQFIPDAIHHPGFPATVLKAEEQWSHSIEYKFVSDISTNGFQSNH